MKWKYKIDYMLSKWWWWWCSTILLTEVRSEEDSKAYLKRIGRQLRVKRWVVALEKQSFLVRVATSVSSLEKLSSTFCVRIDVLRATVWTEEAEAVDWSGGGVTESTLQPSCHPLYTVNGSHSLWAQCVSDLRGFRGDLLMWHSAMSAVLRVLTQV